MIDGRVVIMAAFTLLLWSTNAAAQRMVVNTPRVPVPRLVAMFAGSRERCVLWRNLAIQIGVVTNLLLYAFLLPCFGRSSIVLAFTLSMVVIAVLLVRKPGI